MEDEECLPENSGLKTYLEDLGYSDIEVKKNISSNLSGLNFIIPKPELNCAHVESVDEEIIEEISIIVSCRMLFEEDVSNIEKLLSSFKIVRNGIMRSVFQGISGVAIIFLGLILYWVIGSYALILVSSLYAYKAADYLWTKHYNKTRLSKLISVLQGNFDLVKRTVNFVEENNKLLECSNSNVQSIFDDPKQGFEIYFNFRSDFQSTLNEMVDVLLKSTLKLIHEVPLTNFLENPQYYICNNLDESFYESASLQKLYQIYLLAQSEFLQRLILSLIPHLQSTSNNDNSKKVNRIIIQTCVNLLKIKNSLNKKFRFIFFNGVYSSKPKMEVRLPVKNKSCKTSYATELISGIHDTSNTFQNLLIKSRIIEENIKSEKIPSNIEDELLSIQNDLNACQKNISDSFILLKKANDPTYVQGNEKASEVELQKSGDEINSKSEVIIRHDDVDPSIEDEIFEAYFGDDNFYQTHGADAFDDWDFEDKLKKKLEKEYSKNVIKELKVKLIEKAKNWKKRELEALRKKNISVTGFLKEIDDVEEEKNLKDSNDNLRTEDVNGTPVKQEIKDSKCEKFDGTAENLLVSEKQPLYSVKENIVEQNLFCVGKNENMSFPQDNKDFDEIECQQSQHLLGQKDFLNDLSQARQRIFKMANPVEDEYSWSSDGDVDDITVM